MNEFAPQFRESSFRCPHCSAYAQQSWAQQLRYTEDLADSLNLDDQEPDTVWGDLARATCLACREDSVWKMVKGSNQSGWESRPTEGGARLISFWVMIWPRESIAEVPHKAMPDGLRELYEEARAVLPDSPRAAAALLRLLMEKLLQKITGVPGNLNKQIGLLVERGTFDKQLQETADTIRVSGNAAVHPAEIQSQGDTKEVALAMFELVNFLVDDLIARPRKISHMYRTAVPEGAREAIARRDGDKA